MFALYGARREDFAGAYEAWMSRVEASDQARVQGDIEAAVKGERDYNTEFTVQLPSGETSAIRAAGIVVRNSAGAAVRMVGFNVDVTESRRADQALRASEAKLRTLFELSPIGIALNDFATGAYLDVNAALIAPSGYTREEFLNLSYWDITPAKYEASEREQIHLLNTTGRFGPYEKEYRRKDGTCYPVVLNGVKTIDPSGRAVIWCIIEDITERKQTEQEILHTNDQLATAIANANQLALEAELASIANSAFLANMSHEIRTPMNGVIGMLGLLLDTPLSPEQRNFAEVASSSGDALLSLINDILDFSKIEAGKLELENIPLDLAKLLSDVSPTLALRAHDQNIEFICDIAPGVPTLINGDPVRLRQIILNLAGNALKFTSKGEVAIHVTVESTTRADTLLRFSVTDTGLGIPADKIPILFTKFSQVDASTTRKYGGTGLGLAISKQLAELMGGSVGVKSEVGHGSEFWFTVRLSLQTTAPAPAATPSPALRAARVLLVEDNATSRNSLTRRLEFWGIEVTVAVDGTQGLAALEAAATQGRPYALVLVDYYLPTMNAESFGRAVFANPQLAQTRLVAMPQLGKPKQVEGLLALGFAGYITKPINVSELLRTLESSVSAPVAPKAAAVPSASTQQAVTGGRAKSQVRILLADDNPTNQLVASSVLGKLGYRCDTVWDGSEAVAALSATHYDIVLMDVQMPIMDGYEATATIRSGESTVLNPAVPLIAMTAHALVGDRQRCLSAGMNDYVSKPIDPAALSAAIERMLTLAPVRLPGSALIAPAAEPAATPAAKLPLLNLSDARARLFDDEEILRALMSAVLPSIDENQGKLSAAMQAADYAVARRVAHSFRGASSNIGAQRLAENLADFEKALTASQIAEAAAILGDIDRDCAELRIALRDFLEGQPHPTA
jgi:PAS domain S-box-containing protein